MKKWGEKLSSKTNFSAFLKLVALICGKEFRRTKNIKKMKFKIVWASWKQDIVSRDNHSKFQRQTLNFMWNSALRGNCSFCFQEIFTSSYKIFITREELSTRPKVLCYSATREATCIYQWSFSKLTETELIEKCTLWKYPRKIFKTYFMVTGFINYNFKQLFRF